MTRRPDPSTPILFASETPEATPSKPKPPAKPEPPKRSARKPYRRLPAFLRPKKIRPAPPPPAVDADALDPPPGIEPEPTPLSFVWCWIAPDARNLDWIHARHVPALVLDATPGLTRVVGDDLRRCWVRSDRVGKPCEAAEFSPITWAFMTSYADRQRTKHRGAA